MSSKKKDIKCEKEGRKERMIKNQIEKGKRQ
jgi:hypothetical protein